MGPGLSGDGAEALELAAPGTRDRAPELGAGENALGPVP